MTNGSNAPAKDRKHPAAGLVFFGLAIVTGAISVLLFVISFFPARGTYAEQRFNNIAFVFAFGIAPLFHRAGLILGIVGAFIKESKKIFPIFGIVLNSLPLLLAIVIWLIILMIVLAVIGSGGGWT